MSKKKPALPLAGPCSIDSPGVFRWECVRGRLCEWCGEERFQFYYSFEIIGRGDFCHSCVRQRAEALGMRLPA